MAKTVETKFITALLISSAVSILIATTKVQAETEMVPLSEFSRNMDEQDPVAVSYLLKRCSALYFTMSGMLEGSTKPGMAEAGEQYKDAATRVLLLAAELEKTITSDPEEQVAKEVVDQTTAMGHRYVQRVNEERIRSGHATNDPLISSDLDFCKQNVGTS